MATDHAKRRMKSRIGIELTNELDSILLNMIKTHAFKVIKIKDNDILIYEAKIDGIKVLLYYSIFCDDIITVVRSKRNKNYRERYYELLS